MESDCLSMLPMVCKALANPKLQAPDDASLDKLLDWFKELSSQNDWLYITQHQPALLQLLQSVTQSKAIDPIVLSFTLKLAGLLAAEEGNFNLLEETGVLLYLFDPDSWQKLDLWKSASVRCGWLHGLWNMLQHQQAMDLFCKKGLIKVVLSLQNDESLFVGSLSNEILAHILNFIMLNVLSNNTVIEAKSCSPLSTDWNSISAEVMSHVAKSLASQEQAIILSGLRLLTVALAKCEDPLKEMLWKCVLEPLEVLANLQDDSLTQPIMAVLQAAARSHLFIKPECRLGTLMDGMLCLRNPNESVKCATLILQLPNCPETLKRKAADVIIFPLLCNAAPPLQSHGPDDWDLCLEKQPLQRISSISRLTQSLSSIAHLVCMKHLGNIPIHLVTSSVISLLRMCVSHHTDTFAKVGTFPHLGGYCKVQRYSLDVLGNLIVYKESEDLIQEAFAVLLLYLQCPDLHATVLKKAYQVNLKLYSICSPSSDLWNSVSHGVSVSELFPLLIKLTCDERWEVRDSTLEFIMQLTAIHKGNSRYAEALHKSGMISVLFTSLSDVEGYVRASAVAALGEALATTDLPLCTRLQEEAVTHLLTILNQDTESFPRRAVVNVFKSWLKCELPVTVLDNSLNSVLSLGSSDFDWEVKVQTLDIADMLIKNSLNQCPNSVHTCQPSKSSCIKQALNKMMDLGLFDLLLKCLFDCDRPVSQKACTLLLKLRTLMRETFGAGYSDLALEISTCSWGEEILQRYLKKSQAEELNRVEYGDDEFYRKVDSKDSNPDQKRPKTMSLYNTLELLDLDDMQFILSLSSDHVMNSPQSVMEDILFLTQQSEESVADCY